MGTVDTDATQRFADIVGATGLLTGEQIGPDYGHDEALVGAPVLPRYVARPQTAEQVAALLAAATEAKVPVTARGSGTGMSAGARPCPDGLLISFERMNAILEIDTDNQVAVVQPGVTLADLDIATAPAGLMYTVFPGELSASIGGNVGTNAGGMRAVKYGVTRNNVLGLQAALPTGELIRTGGRITKLSTGYDLTQLIIGSEGTCALATEVTVRLYPRLGHSATLLAPFTDLPAVMRAVPEVVRSGVDPVILEYVDKLTLAAISYSQNLNLGIPDEVRETAEAFLVVGVENRDRERLDDDVAMLGELLATLGAVDVYVLEGNSAHALIEAREKAFWTAKAAGAHDVIDVVVPRAMMHQFLTKAQGFAQGVGAGVVGCGHAGDGNVHLAVFCADDEVRHGLLHDIFAAAMDLGGAISGEHGLGRVKTQHFLELEDPVKIALMRRIKDAFDPAGILNPGVLL
ncbi:FAD-binding oxidoreductase [Mycolicibacter arupensis]|jgi:glycolate oxidase|uniref:FAD-binding oxidoreductase n=1 Tax=Mycolicibacter arupensis TaxID=342002 RepID=A0A0F5N0S1_9MYCO|nr:FAD-linked oxidase C-terminal domain-containing protein [Mycolicibacter arupensis]KKC00654.1 FAD-binding protein [Mycolicibacter arupensis]MCV7276794.1 FAD-binding protein [Mycolicibacter arupensis]OQZ96826.1 FAD-binding oxidoreductase [Mycolicibacter arupensis]TXI57830.1 MAG: FAD-binding protein [Mycolicibacter arupensis]